MYLNEAPEAWYDVQGPDWESTRINGSKKIIENKRKTEAGKKDLPSMNWSEAASLIHKWLTINLNINFSIK